MTGKKLLFLLGIFSLLVFTNRSVDAQSLPWVEVWVTVRDWASGQVLADARVENPACQNLPADSCTRYGVWDESRQAYILKTPRLEPYELVVTRSGYETQMRSGTAADPLTTWDVRLYPSQPGVIRRVYLPLISVGGSIPLPVYNPTAAVGRLNWWRGLAGAPAVTGNLEMHSGCRAHARWMVNNQTAAHTEDPNLPGYTYEGDACGQAGILTFGVNVYPTDEQAVDVLLASPFHALAALDPRLGEVGFGSARLDTFWSGTYAAAALNVYHGVDWSRTLSRQTFPRDGGTLPILSYNGLAQPNPLTACPGYTAPSGPALLLLSAPSETPVSTTLAQGSALLEHCLISASTYTNPNEELKRQGRSTLYGTAALMIMPRYPLQADKTYTMTLVYSSGQRVQWSFTTLTNPLNILPMQALLPYAD